LLAINYLFHQAINEKDKGQLMIVGPRRAVRILSDEGLEGGRLVSEHADGQRQELRHPRPWISGT